MINFKREIKNLVNYIKNDRLFNLRKEEKFLEEMESKLIIISDLLKNNNYKDALNLIADVNKELEKNNKLFSVRLLQDKLREITSSINPKNIPPYR